MSRKKSSGSGDATLSGVETAIPKKIHQIYFGDDLSERLKANARELRDLNPGWEYALYDAHMGEDFIRTHYGADVLQAYHHLDPRYYAARADLLRYLIVYREGGVYLDIKSRFEGPIDKFIRGDEGFVLSQWRNGTGEIHEGFGIYRDIAFVPGGEFQNFHVIGAAKHPFLNAVIEAVLRNINAYAPWHAVGRTGVVRVTGPVAYTRAIFPLLELFPHKRVRHEGEIGLQYSIPEAYDPDPVRGGHYSAVSDPLVRMSAPGKIASGLFAKLRSLGASARRRS
ncbi:glycosyltransferase family 32 protein [Sphingomonas daechungensis]|uniref:glycosyltransferase family 32 protein n=1 Tax=Sphingomonas daechungensis TaxID=1176646 RepID=UPI0037850FE2